MIAVPVFALAPSLDGSGVPLVSPTEEAKGAGRGLAVMLFSLVSAALAGLALWSWSTGWFWWFILGETCVALAIYAMIRRRFVHMRWRAQE